MRHRHALWSMLCLVLSCSEDRPPAGPVAGADLIGAGDTTLVNVPPSVDAGPDLRTQPGAPLPLTFRIADPDSETSWTYSIAWGDGTTDSGGAQSHSSLFSAGHVYGQAGRYVVGVTAADPRGGTATDTLTAFVEPPDTPLTKSI